MRLSFHISDYSYLFILSLPPQINVYYTNEYIKVSNKMKNDYVVNNVKLIKNSIKIKKYAK